MCCVMDGTSTDLVVGGWPRQAGAVWSRQAGVFLQRRSFGQHRRLFLSRGYHNTPSNPCHLLGAETPSKSHGQGRTATLRRAAADVVVVGEQASAPRLAILCLAALVPALTFAVVLLCFSPGAHAAPCSAAGRVNGQLRSMQPRQLARCLPLVASFVASFCETRAFGDR